MNHKALYLNLLATAVLLGAGTAQAASMSLEDAIRLQMHDASDRINADIGATLKAQPLILDVPGVEVGEIELVETRQPETRRSSALPTTADASIDDMIQRDIIAKALEVPGMFGVYRYMAASALTVAIIVAE